MEKVEQFITKNQFLIKSKGKTTFQSYNSIIAIIKNGVLTLGKNWNYSQTTSKYLYLFIETYFYQLGNEQRKIFLNFEEEKNKKQFLQSLIDKKIIKIIKEV